MEELPRRPALDDIRKEQERERRRIRDRQRRQSMTVEQRENHLARRRKNYQLRRERIKYMTMDYQSGQIGMPFMGGNFVSEFSNQYNGLVPNGYNQVMEKLNAQRSSSVGKECLTYNLARLQKRLRLIHVKHFARSLKRPLSELTGCNIQIIADLILKGNSIANCKSKQGVRLNRIKQLARAQDSASKAILYSQNKMDSEGQNPPKEEQPVSTEMPGKTLDDAQG